MGLVAEIADQFAKFFDDWIEVGWSECDFFHINIVLDSDFSVKKEFF